MYSQTRALLHSSCDFWTCWFVSNRPDGAQEQGVQRHTGVVEVCKRQRCETLVVLLRDNESRIHNIKVLMLGEKISWDLTPSQTPESGSYRSPMSPVSRKPSILVSCAWEATWGCSYKCCDWFCALPHGSWSRCSSQSGHGWHSAGWLSHLGKWHISLCRWLQAFPPACLQPLLKATLQ